MCESLELGSASAPPSSFELLASDRPIDLSDPLVRSLPVSTLAIAVAAAAIRGDRESRASAAVSDVEASLSGEIGAGEAQP